MAAATDVSTRRVLYLAKIRTTLRYSPGWPQAQSRFNVALQSIKWLLSWMSTRATITLMN